MTDTFTLVKADRPESRRGSSTLGVDWVAKIGPTLKENIGENFLLKSFGPDDKSKAISLAATVNNHMWKRDPKHEYSIVARTADNGTHGVHAKYIGPMSDERRAELVAARLARTPLSRRKPEDGGPVPEAPVADSPAARAKAAAGK